MTRYVIRGGADGKSRLRVIARALRASTLGLLQRIGIRDAFTCVDLGCGGGDVSLEMARLVGRSGRVVGIDMDADKLRLARAEADEQHVTNVEYRVQDVREFAERDVYDLGYARFLLTHLVEPGALLERLFGSVVQDGAVAIEDIDYSGIVCHPRSRAVERHIELYRELVKRRGGDADIGQRLPALMRTAGARDVQVQLVQPTFLHGEAKRIYSITTASIAGPLIAEGLCSADEVEALIEDLDRFASDPLTLLSFPRIFQCWGWLGPDRTATTPPESGPASSSASTAAGETSPSSTA